MLLTKLANQEVFNFLKTVTIKNSYFADQLKKALVNDQYRSLVTDAQNPYYMHLMGKYILKDAVSATVSDPETGVKYKQKYKNTLDLTREDGTTLVAIPNTSVYVEDAFDEMMYVTSLDTQEEIPFTRENLHGDAANAASAVHKKTLEAYKVPSRYFDMLCEKYPKQVDLIKSIVYLVPPKELSDVEKATYGEALPSKDELRLMRLREAKHLTLVNCDDEILESRERSNLLDVLNGTLDLIRSRWDVSEYGYEENYAGVHWAMVWSLLPLLLIAQRYYNIKTPCAHSSHVWDYLTSNGLDSYRGYLSSEQEWFLYKNIKFLQENRGQHRVLNILVDNLLADYNLHIESKTVVLDKSNILKVDTINTNYAEQCSLCSRKDQCYKNITAYKCDDFVGCKNLFKPEPVILTEPLSGARKDKILNLLQSRYDCTGEEAQERYDRSFVWRDEAIELIKKELDRDQTIDMNGMIESLEDVIKRENNSGLEPEFSDEVVAEQRKDLRHIRSSYLPTKLVEITEDPVEPRYEEMFTKFFTDTLLHLAPYMKDGSLISRVLESYTVTVGQDALSFIFNFGELIAALYLGFVKEYGPDTVIDVNTGTSYNPKWERAFLSNFLENRSFDFNIPAQARIGFTFKLGKPVKQQDLVDAMEGTPIDVSDIGNYVVVGEDEAVDLDTQYYIDRNGSKVLAGNYGYLSEFDPDVTYYKFVTLADQVTNGTATIVKINDIYYAVSGRTATEEDIGWYEYGYTNVYTILGRFLNKSDGYVYQENNGEIGMIPRYFKWHYNHLYIPVYATKAELDAVKSPSKGDIAGVYERGNRGIYIYTNQTESSSTLVWREVQSQTLDGIDVSQVTYTVNPMIDVNGCERCVSKFGINEGEERKQFSTSIIPAHSQRSVKFSQVDTEIISKFGQFSGTKFVTKDSLGKEYPEFETIEEFTDYVNNKSTEIYDVYEIDRFINVDWILDNLYVDFMDVYTSQEVIGAYFEKMFTIYERLDIIRSGCGDICTKKAIETFMESVLIDQKIKSITRTDSSKQLFKQRPMKDFHLITVSENSNPTYSDWFKENEEIGEAFKKLDESADRINLWDEFNTKLCAAVLEGCNLGYASTSTDRTRYLKLKALVQSLSSYLINFIDTSTSGRVSTELSHIAEDYPSREIEFTSYINFEPVGQILDCPSFADVNEDIFLPAEERHAKDKIKYYVKDMSVPPEESSFIEDTTEVGDILYPSQRYFKINLRDLLNVGENERLMVWYEDDQWYYATGRDVKIDGASVTYKGAVYKTSNLPETAAIGSLYHINTSDTNYLRCRIDDVDQWLDLGDYTGETETYAGDVKATKVIACELTSQTQLLLKGKNTLDNLGAKVYKKPIDIVKTIWGATKQNEQLSIYMRLMVEAYHLNLVSEYEVQFDNYAVESTEYQNGLANYPSQLN